MNLSELLHPAEAPSPPVADVKAYEALYCDVVTRLDRLEQKLTAAYRLVAASQEVRDREHPVRPRDDRGSVSHGDGQAGDGPNSGMPV